MLERERLLFNSEPNIYWCSPGVLGIKKEMASAALGNKRSRVEVNLGWWSIMHKTRRRISWFLFFFVRFNFFFLKCLDMMRVQVMH